MRAAAEARLSRAQAAVAASSLGAGFQVEDGLGGLALESGGMTAARTSAPPAPPPTSSMQQQQQPEPTLSWQSYHSPASYGQPTLVPVQFDAYKPVQPGY
jgi:hypothetical protein